MGIGQCRFGCKDGTNVDYGIIPKLEEYKDIFAIAVCGLWKHYATEHNMLPHEKVREIIMKTDPKKAVVKTIYYRGEISGYHDEMSSEGGPGRILLAYFVEKLPDGRWNHEIGECPDSEFIEKLKGIIEYKSMLRRAKRLGG
ncbi:MAG: hypothetical protein QW703_00010 [Candidatus Aenigmatarchaeota archaeon]